MPLVLTEEQQMLVEAARVFLTDRAPVSHLRGLRDADDANGFSQELWSEIAELGWPAVLVPEDHGGLGYGHVGIGLLLQQCGRTLTPTPLLATAMMGVAGVDRFGNEVQRRAVLPGIAAGEHLIAIAVDDSSQHRPDVSSCTAIAGNGGYVLDGTKVAVVDGHVANTLIVSAATGASDELSLFLVPAGSAGISIEVVNHFDTHKVATVTFDKVRIGSDAVLGEPGQGATALDYMLDVGRIGQSAELLGVAEEAFERTVGYLKERKQFGVPIGSFQALQHRAAIMFGEIELARSAVLHALQSLDAGTGELPQIASMTKSRVAETAHTVTTEAVQMHGGIGMTDEYDIGFFLKRCQILETLYGDRYYHIDRFATLRGY